MSFTLTAKHVTESQPDHFVMEASDLSGLAAGDDCGTLPMTLQTTLGNATPFRYTGREVYDGETQAFLYRQTGSNARLTVFND